MLQNCNTGTAHDQKTVDPIGQPKCEKKKKKTSPKPQIKNTTKNPQNRQKKRKRNKSQSTNTTQCIIMPQVTIVITLYLLQELLKITDDA